MNRLLVLLVLGAAVAATSAADDNTNLLKRLLDVLEEKRSMNVFIYDGQTLTVSYKACVRGDKSQLACKNRNGVDGHTLYITDANNNPVTSFHEKDYIVGYGGPHRKYPVGMLKDGQLYHIIACETYPNPNPKKGEPDTINYQCNEGDLIGGQSKMGFGTRVTRPIDDRFRNPNSIRT